MKKVCYHVDYDGKSSLEIQGNIARCKLCGTKFEINKISIGIITKAIHDVINQLKCIYGEEVMRSKSLSIDDIEMYIKALANMYIDADPVVIRKRVAESIKSEDFLPKELLSKITDEQKQLLVSRMDNIRSYSPRRRFICDHVDHYNNTPCGKFDLYSGVFHCRKCSTSYCILDNKEIREIERTVKWGNKSGVTTEIYNGNLITRYSDGSYDTNLFDEIPEDDQRKCIEWINNIYDISVKIHRYDSNYINQKLFNDINIKLSDNQFKHLMLICGHKPVDETAGYWEFNIRYKK